MIQWLTRQACLSFLALRHLSHPLQPGLPETRHQGERSDALRYTLAPLEIGCRGAFLSTFLLSGIAGIMAPSFTRQPVHMDPKAPAETLLKANVDKLSGLFTLLEPT